MHNKFFQMYKKLEFWQKVIIFVSILAVITFFVSISIMLNIDIENLALMNFHANLFELSLAKVSAIIITLIALCIFTLIL